MYSHIIRSNTMEFVDVLGVGFIEVSDSVGFIDISDSVGFINISVNKGQRYRQKRRKESREEEG